MDAILDCYKAGRRAYPVFTAHLKDEAVTLAKVQAKKVRLFAGAPVDWSLVVRMYLLSFVKLLQDNKYAFEAAPGTCCQSTEWHRIYEHLTEFSSTNMINGDFGSFDKYMFSQFISNAFRVIIKLHEEAGWDEEECLILQGIGMDISFHVCNMKGDLVEFFGTNPSGHPLTVIVNSIVNCLYMRYVFYILYMRSEQLDHYTLQTQEEIHSFLQLRFSEFVKLMTYGDDNIMGVHPDAPWYNHTAIQNCLAEIGVVYTMAEKDAESVPYIPIKECSFLKRKWRFDKDVNAYLCPIEEDSIIRSTTVWVPSSTIDEYAQMVAVCSSACGEYFFYGKEKFNEKRNFYMKLLANEPYCYYVRDTTLPTWEQLKMRFWNNSEWLPDIDEE